MRFSAPIGAVESQLRLETVNAQTMPIRGVYFDRKFNNLRPGGELSVSPIIHSNTQGKRFLFESLGGDTADQVLDLLPSCD